MSTKIGVGDAKMKNWIKAGWSVSKHFIVPTIILIFFLSLLILSSISLFPILDRLWTTILLNLLLVAWGVSTTLIILYILRECVPDEKRRLDKEQRGEELD